MDHLNQQSKQETNDLPPCHYYYQGIPMGTNFFPEHQVTRILNMAYKSSDVVLVTYPRSGTLLTMETIWQIKHQSHIYTGQQSTNLNNWFPFLELSSDLWPIPNSVETLANQWDNPHRYIKTHMPSALIWSALNKQDGPQKIVVVIRNPKDVVNSLFHFYQSVAEIEYDGWPYNDWNTLFDAFSKGKVTYGDYFDWLAGWLQFRDDPRFLIVRYESLINDPNKEIKRLANFLGESDISDQTVEIISGNIAFNQMAKNKDINIVLNEDDGSTLMRKGLIGDWKALLSKEQSEYMDKRIENCLKELNLGFSYY